MPLYFGGTHIGGAKVSVITPKLQNKIVTPTTSEQIITPDTGYDGLNQVTVAASTGTNEDLTAVLDAQEQLIDELEAELEGKAADGGGASIETCTVSVPNSIGGGIYVTTYRNGEFFADYLVSKGTGTIAGDISNVVCGSTLIIALPSVWVRDISGAEYITADPVYPDNHIYRITVGAGETVTVTGTINM